MTLYKGWPNEIYLHLYVCIVVFSEFTSILYLFEIIHLQKSSLYSAGQIVV